MPTDEEKETVSEQIEDVIGRRYIESDGDMCSCWFQPETAGPIGMTIVQGTVEGTPEPFNEIPRKAQIELLHEFVNWKGFSDGQQFTVMQRVIEGECRDTWMEGIDAVAPDAHLPKANDIARLQKEIEQRREPEPEIEYGD